MMNLRTVASGVFAVMCLALGLGAQGHAQYRDFQLGADLASVATQSGVAATQAKVLHQRPAVMKELTWRPGYWINGSSTRQTDPVQQILFSFFNDQLFRLVVDYDRQRTDGMTDSDMIQAISAVYGPHVTPKPKAAGAATPAIETESGTAIARWGDPDYSVVLYRSVYVSAFRLIVASPKVEVLARTATVEAIRLDTREAPQREVARQVKEKEDDRAAQEKARDANKAAFRP